MKIFLSWSTELSHKIAKEFRDWLPMVIQSIEPYVSSEDIDKGTRWSVDIATELHSSSFGILIITLENLKAPWLNFEAGALSKAVDTSKVSPFLFNLRASDMTGSPLLQFQSTSNDRDDVRKLMHSVNASLGSDKLTDEKLNKTFERWWPDLEAKLLLLKQEYDKSNTTEHKPKSKDKQQEILEELLELTRSQQKILSNPEAILPKAYLKYITKNEDESLDYDLYYHLMSESSYLIRDVLVSLKASESVGIDNATTIEKLRVVIDRLDEIRSRISINKRNSRRASRPQ